MRCALHHVSAVLVGAFYMDRAGTVYMKDEVAILAGLVRDAGWYQRAKEHPNSVVLGCYDTSRTRVVRTSQQNKRRNWERSRSLCIGRRAFCACRCGTTAGE